MNHSTGKPTKAEAARLDRLCEIGCIACRHEVRFTPSVEEYQPIERHHLLSGNKRRGHLFTVPLCRWHHRGVPLTGWLRREMSEAFGPSLALASKAFRARYGSDDDLLKETNRLLVGED